MWNSDGQRLPDWIREAFELIVAHIDDPDKGLPRARALEILLAQAEFEDAPEDAEYAIERLLDRGWFYEVEGVLRVTDPDRDPE